MVSPVAIVAESVEISSFADAEPELHLLKKISDNAAAEMIKIILFIVDKFLRVFDYIFLFESLILKNFFHIISPFYMFINKTGKIFYHAVGQATNYGIACLRALATSVPLVVA
jgi:hypothetical protein